MSKSIELREKRANLINQAREVWDRQEQESRDLSQEEKSHYERIMAEVDQIKERIDEEERLENLEKELAAPIQNHDPNQHVGRSADEGAEYRQAFWRAVRYGAHELDLEEKRSLNIGSNSEGGYTVPDEFERRLVEALADEVVMRSLATVRTSESGERDIPIIDDHGSATWLDEEGSYQESDITYNQKVISAHKLGRIIKVSEEFLQDAFMDVPSHIEDVFRRTFGEEEEEAFVKGDSANKPEGVMVGGQEGKEAAATDEITALELIDLYHSLRRPYRGRANWLASDDAIKTIRKLKDDNDHFLWQPGLQAGEPDRILGRPVYISEKVDDLGAENKPLAFGDFSKYWILDRRGITMQRLNEKYAESGQVGFRMHKRTDGKLVLAEAVKYLKMSSA